MRRGDDRPSVDDSAAAVAAWIRSGFARWILSAPLEPTTVAPGELGGARRHLRRGAELVLEYASLRETAELGRAHDAASWALDPAPTSRVWVCGTEDRRDAAQALLASRSCMLVDLRAMGRSDGPSALLLLDVAAPLRARLLELPGILRRLDEVATQRPRGGARSAAAPLRAVRDSVERIFREHAFGGALLVGAREDDVPPGDAGDDEHLGDGFGRAWLSAEDDGGGGGSAEIFGPPPLRGAQRAAPELDFYELVVVDEHEAPIAGVKVTVSTPAGTVTKTTGGDGRVRVDDAPRGTGSATLASAANVRDVLAGRERAPRRRRPLPTEGDWTFRTLSRLDGAVVLPSGARRRLMLVTRTDVYSAGDLPAWGELAAGTDGPWELVAKRAAAVRLQVHADATGRAPEIRGEPPAATRFPPPDVTPTPRERARWRAPDTYVVQPGDTLGLIARRYLGSARRWPEIVAANPELLGARSPDLIYVGELFRMPPHAVPAWLRAMNAPPSPPPDKAPPAAPLWSTMDTGTLHDALFDRRLDQAIGLISSLPVDPPRADDDPPPPVLEGLLFAGNLLGAAPFEVDPPFDPPDEIVRHPKSPLPLEASHGAQSTRRVA